MGLAENDDVIQALATDRSDQPLSKCDPITGQTNAAQRRALAAEFL